ncbi:DUF5753 domain-containing protein [Pseudonocardia broussonetiae]|uniref:Helix-turn-helix domain-containing protein n=1 Tax=Pseudonocardia broussonetiae TaxID=2736640 RepID=A0A6M6JGB5_9PSEU|nr:DUF5753 domain-containing protein [Pseudonocardia broussonetiae]QJY46183.1 helix-turn-helix domain-containing protein [Pseudonocardia broussonetiae]
MTAEPNPTFARRRLAVRLRALRERDDRSLSDLAAHLNVSLAQASRLDTGARGFQLAQVEELAQWYRLPKAERALLAELVIESRKRAWWQQIDLPDSYRTLIGLEAAAESINEYCSGVISGLLQIPEYAAAAAASGVLDFSEEEVSRAVEVRVHRQRDLERRSPRPYVWVIIDESALARTAGGPAVMARQLARVLEAASLPRTTIQVVGFEAGPYLGTTSSQFILLKMGDDVSDVLYADGPAPSDTDDPTAVAEHTRIWQLLSALALDPQASRLRIQHYLDLCCAADTR